MSCFSILLKLCAFLYPLALSAANLPSTQLLLDTYEDSKSYKDVSWLTTHNAFANYEDGWAYAQQNRNISAQFAHGVRSFMVDLHWYNPKGSPSTASYLALCHLSCQVTPAGYLSLDPPIKAVDFFTKIATLLHNNPQDIITLHFESYSTHGRLNSSGWSELEALFTKSGLNHYLNKDNPNSTGLILGKMRSNNTRLVVFSDNFSDTIDPKNPGNSTGIFHTTEYRETKYSLSGFKQCERRDDNRALGVTKNLLVMNHFHSFSQESSKKPYGRINSYAKIATRINQCRGQEGIFPNFIAVDFVEEGHLGGAKEAVIAINQAISNQETAIPIEIDPNNSRTSLDLWLPASCLACGIISHKYPKFSFLCPPLAAVTSTYLHRNSLEELVPGQYLALVYPICGIGLNCLYKYAGPILCHWRPVLERFSWYPINFFQKLLEYFPPFVMQVRRYREENGF